MSDATLVFSLSEDGYNVLIDDWLILLWLYYALMDELRMTELPAPETGSAASGEDPNEEDDALRRDAMCPNMRMAPFALRYDCTPWASRTSGEMVCRMSREQLYQESGRGFLLVFVPSTDTDAVSPAVDYGHPSCDGERASSSTDYAGGAAVPYIFPKGKGKNYS